MRANGSANCKEAKGAAGCEEVSNLQFGRRGGQWEGGGGGRCSLHTQEALSSTGEFVPVCDSMFTHALWNVALPLRSVVPFLLSRVPCRDR
jgi:hypothetical protein